MQKCIPYVHNGDILTNEIYPELSKADMQYFLFDE